MTFRVLDPSKGYSFSQYFDLPYTAEDILADLGCTIIRDRLKLPTYCGTLDRIQFLHEYLERNLSFTTPVSEISRREVLVAPILFEVCDQVQARLNSEYTVRVNEWLKGTLDYYLVGPSGLLVIEAKQADLAKGFTQLAVELIALDQWIDSPAPILRGAVTTGDLWKFGEFDRADHIVREDRTIYRVPDELEQVFRILVAIAQGIQSQ